jgi:glycosyltransferase involved in cell wall biosynthesis
MADRSTFFVAGHLPPPVHGESVATAAFVDILEAVSEASEVRIDVRRISEDPQRSRLTHHLQRSRRVAAAIISLVRGRRHALGLYVSADAGLGMAYTMALCLTARCCGLPAYVHHHSASYLGTTPELRMKLLCGIAGPRTGHIVGCELTARRFEKLYRRTNVDVVPIGYAVDRPVSSDRRPAPRRNDAGGPARRIRVGHLSNLSVAKGLVDVFTTVEALSGQGMAVTLLIAGPPASEADGDRLHQLLAGTPHHVEYIGPVSGAAREEFFENVDVFIFPSRYRHESFGLVVGEALVRGVPVVATASGCLTAELVGSAGRILPRSADFPARASTWIAENLGDPQRQAQALAGTEEFASWCDDAQERAHDMARQMVSVAVTKDLSLA